MLFKEISKKEAIELFLSEPERLYYLDGGAGSVVIGPLSKLSDMLATSFRADSARKFYVKREPVRVYYETDVIQGIRSEDYEVKLATSANYHVKQEFKPGTRVRVTIEELP
jgi:hypothetical protein